MTIRKNRMAGRKHLSLNHKYKATGFMTVSKIQIANGTSWSAPKSARLALRVYQLHDSKQDPRGNWSGCSRAEQHDER